MKQLYKLLFSLIFILFSADLIFAQNLSLVLPKDNIVLNDSVVSFQWSRFYTYANFEIEVDTNINFTAPTIHLSSLSTPSLSNQSLLWGRKYYWRVRANTGATYSAWSNTNSFIIFKPTIIPNIAAWFVASAKVTLTSGAVSNWQSNAPDTTNLSQATVLRRPTLNASFANGKPAVYFNGTLHFLNGGDVLDIRTNDFTYLTIHAPELTDNYTIFSKSLMTPSNNRYGLFKISGQWQYQYYNTADTSTYTAYRATSNVLLQSEVINRSTMTKKEYINDSLIRTGYCNPASYDFNTGLVFSVGATNFSYFYRGHIPELIMYRRALTDSLLALSQQYLSNKYYPPVNLGPDTFLTSLCASPILLKADTSFTSFLWSTGSTSSSISVSSLGKYWVKVTNKLGYTSTDTINIYPLNANPLNRTYGLCLNDSLVLNAGFNPSSYAYLWSNGDTSQTTKLRTPGNYTIRVTDRISGCSYTYDTIAISVDSFSFNIGFGADTTLNNGEQLALNNGASLVDSFFWFNGARTSTISADRTGNYWLIAKNTNNCTAKDTIHVTLNTVPICSGGVSLVSPINGVVLNDTVVNFIWSKYYTLTSYDILVDTNADFSTPSINQTGVTTTFLNNQNLLWGRSYYWKVRAFNGIDYAAWSTTASFTIFNPTYLSGIATWLNASAGVTLTAGVVSNWQSSAPDATNLIQSTTSRRPILNTAFANGKSSIYFNGTSQFLTAGDLFDIRTNNFTYITLHAPEHPDNYAVIAKSLNTPANNLYGIFKTGGQWQFQYRTTADSSTYSSYLVNNNALLQSEVIDRSSLQKMEYINDTLIHTDICSPAVYDFNTGQPFTVGAVNFLNFYKGNIPEIIIYRQALDNASLHLVHRYLSDKYYPPVNLGPDTFVTSLCPVPILLKADTTYTSYLWSNGSTTSSTLVNGIGTYWVRAVNKLGFVSFDTICVIPLSINSVHPIMSNYKICQGDSVLIDVGFDTLSYHFLWNTGETTSIRSIKNPGNYSVRITENATGCEINLDTINFEVDSFRFHFSVGNDTSICAGNVIGVQSDRAAIDHLLWNTADTSFNITISSIGNYSAIATNTFGCMAVDTIRVIIKGNAPNIDFITTNNCLYDSMTTINLSTTSSPDMLHQWKWFFGDGDSSEVFAPKHFFDSIGTYTVSLFAVSDSGCTNNFSRNIIITAIPDANIASSIVCAQSDILINDASISQPGDVVNQWKWNIDDDTFSTQNVHYNFPAAGKYFVSLEVTSGVNGCKDQVQDSFEVFPAINPDFSSMGLCVGDTTKLTDITPSFSIIQREWNINFGSLYAFTPQTKFVFSTSGDYLVTLKVKNAIGCDDSVGKLIHIYQPPTAFFADSFACFNSIKTFTDLSTSIGDTINAWHWTIDTSNYYTQNVNHITNKTTAFTANLAITTTHGCEDNYHKLVQVALPPVANFNFNPTYGVAPLPITFNNMSTNAVAYFWYFNDSIMGTSTLPSPNYTYNSNGFYTITLIATSNEGCSDSISKSININPTDLDMMVDQMKISQQTSISGATEIKPQVRLANTGSRNITNADILSRLDNGTTLAEKWTGLLLPGQSILYTYASSFYLTNPSLYQYICVEATNVNDGTETNLSNNKACKNLNTDGVVGLLYPNPANANASVDIILTEATVVTISVVSELGQVIVPTYDYEANSGLNTVNINTAGLEAGHYFVKIKFYANTEIRKLAISR